MLVCGDCPQFHTVPSAKVENRMAQWGLCLLHLVSTHKDAAKLNQCPNPDHTTYHDMKEAHDDA